MPTSSKFISLTPWTRSPGCRSYLTSNEAQPLTNVIVGTFTGGPLNAKAGEFMASIDWGDGTPATTGLVVPLTGGGFKVIGSHTYFEEGTWFPVVTVSDMGSDGKTKINGVPITITYEDPATTDIDDTANVADVNIIATAAPRLSPASKAKTPARWWWRRSPTRRAPSQTPPIPIRSSRIITPRQSTGATACPPLMERLPMTPRAIPSP